MCYMEWEERKKQKVNNKYKYSLNPEEDQINF